MTLLIPVEQLMAAAARIRAREAAKTAVPMSPVTGFVYQPRTTEQWERRIKQYYRSNRTFRPKDPKPKPPRKPRKKKASAATGDATT